jgi:hypothetical protein
VTGRKKFMSTPRAFLPRNTRALPRHIPKKSNHRDSSPTPICVRCAYLSPSPCSPVLQPCASVRGPCTSVRGLWHTKTCSLHTPYPFRWVQVKMATGTYLMGSVHPYPYPYPHSQNFTRWVTRTHMRVKK